MKKLLPATTTSTSLFLIILLFLLSALPVVAQLPVGFSNQPISQGTNGNSTVLSGPATTLSVGTLQSKLVIASSNIIADANLVAFDELFSNGPDGSDAVKLSNTGENFAINRDDRILVVEARKHVVSKDTVYFKIWNLSQINYRLEFDPYNMNIQGLTIVLVDKFLNTTTAVRTDSLSSKNFTVTADPASKATDRFKLVFFKAALGSLPVNFVSISAVPNNNAVQIAWTVAGENGVSHYEIERSTDGRFFSTTGVQRAIGNSDRVKAYSFTDLLPITTSNFYRVKSVDLNGTVKYSSIVKCNLQGSKSSVVIAPNIIEGSTINFQFTNMAKGKYAVRLINANGQLAYSNYLSHEITNSLHLVTLTQKLSTGNYFVEITSADNHKQVQPILIR